MGDVVNAYIGGFLVPGMLPMEQLGAVRPLLGFVGIAGIPIGFLAMVTLKYLNVFAERGEAGCAKGLLRDALVAAVAFAGIVGVAVWWLKPGLMERLKIDDSQILLWFVVLVLLGGVAGIVSSAVRALKLYNYIVFGALPSPFFRWVAMWVFLPLWGVRGYLAAQSVMTVAGFSVAAVAVWRYFYRDGDGDVAATMYRRYWGEMGRYAAPLLLSMSAGAMVIPMEDFIIRHRLATDVSAAVYVLKTFVEIPTYMVGPIIVFLFPMVSSKFEQGESTRKLLFQSMGMTLLLSLGCAAALQVVAPWLFGLQDSWRVGLPYAGIISVVGLSTACRLTVDCFVVHEQACRRFRYLRFYIPIILLQTLGLYGLMGWGFFEPYLPQCLWQAVEAWPVRTLPFVLWWSAAWQGLLLLCVVFSLTKGRELPRLRH